MVLGTVEVLLVGAVLLLGVRPWVIDRAVLLMDQLRLVQVLLYHLSLGFVRLIPVSLLTGAWAILSVMPASTCVLWAEVLLVPESRVVKSARRLNGSRHRRVGRIVWNSSSSHFVAFLLRVRKWYLLLG